MRSMLTTLAATWVVTIACASGAAVVTVPAVHESFVVNYPQFNLAGDLVVQGDAERARGMLHLTPGVDAQASSAYSARALSLAPNAAFSSHFAFRLSDPDTTLCDGPSTCGADGFVFVLRAAPTGVGGMGGGLGYSGLGHSVGIEFDTWNNGAIDGNSSNHVGIDFGGDIGSLVRAEVLEGDLVNSAVWHAWIDYDGATHLLQVRLSQDDVRPQAATLTLVRDLSGDIGATSVYAGFTSGTGSSHADQDVLSWTLQQRVVAQVAEPGTLALVLLGLAALALAPRRVRAR